MITSNLPTRTSLLFFLAALLLSLAAGTAAADEIQPGGTVSAEVTVLQNDASGVRFALRTPAATVNADGAVTVAGLGAFNSEAGAPQLPFYTTYLAIPPGASFDISVEGAALTSTTAEKVSPAPTYQLREAGAAPESELTQVGRSGFRELAQSLPDAAIYEANAYYPPASHAVGEAFTADGLRLVKLDLFPVRYHPLQKRLQQTAELTVTVIFEGAESRVLQGHDGTAKLSAFWRAHILNQPPASWQVETPQASAAANALPVGKDSYKILVTEDGIHEISGSALAGAGMNIAAVDPASIEMMHRGQPVATQFVNNDGQAGFGPTDTIRFYGWAFDGSRYEDMYVSDNIFWLWAAGNGRSIASLPNEAGQGHGKVTSFDETITEWPHVNFFEGWSVNWDASPNDPTPWHWNLIAATAGNSQRRRLDIALPHPATAGGTQASVLVEFTTRLNTLKRPSAAYNVTVDLNGSVPANATWDDSANVNVAFDVPINSLNAAGAGEYPNNRLNLLLDNSSGDSTVEVYVTRATVEYERNLVAVNDQLIFGHNQAGKHEFHVSGFGAAGNPLVWDISDRYTPQVITMAPANVVPEGGTKRFLIGSTHGSDARFIATTTEQVVAVGDEAITRYTAADLTPPGKNGSWVAIAHGSLIPAAQELATHRAGQSGLSTWIVDVADVYNQYGYGFQTPEAIRAYLRHGLADWNEPPAYVTLFGDATINPRNLDCDVKCTDGVDGWDPDRKTLLVTDLLFVDRFNGLIPVDYTYSLLLGDDIFPDIGVGRITAETLGEAHAAVRKIIRFEKNFASFEPWQNNIYFVADNADSGGTFCHESMETAKLATGAKSFHCLLSEEEAGVPDYEQDYMVPFRDEIFRQINEVGVAVLNYRGHGGVTGWANEKIMHVDFADAWLNPERTPVIISADCLDGHFANTVREGLGETFLKLSNRGSAAHWSSSGLGFTFEHTILHEAFYEAIFDHNTTALGDVINYAKIVYLSKGYDSSEAYAFTFLGDPAMDLKLRHTIAVPMVQVP